MAAAQWIDVGAAEELQAHAVQEVRAQGLTLALTFAEGRFGALHGACNHIGGPLGRGRLEGGFLVCPWHGWRFHAVTGALPAQYGSDCVPAYPVKVEGGRVLVDVANGTPRKKTAFPPHPLARPVERAPGPVRVLGISTTNMAQHAPRFSGSEALLQAALAHARTLGSTAQEIRLRDLAFRACEGYYSVSAHACTWPCTITRSDPKDQLDRVYEALVHGADVALIATPIRWGAPSSLYARMVERMNCIQNQQTIADRVLLKNKVVAFLVLGGQDNVQAVVGQMMAFFGELGCVFPQFPFVAHTRGWSAEDMEENVREVQHSEALRAGARSLVERAVGMAQVLLGSQACSAQVAPGGRKGHELAPDAAP